ncbi:hypothetical protein MesoLjLc_53690 [Mesorhizobium sp. L-8-10]|uniref:type VI immunity family protein n=1 Tax=Mesorhizobium sp. L-8-10 TaxID=2744523 RepID=UPI0019257573|nr:type VI immunity family protein [Mesorhizobium sp. L-8-10]BCH33439.1 hypothetical protein MesoLjLc_53690 [Mesorhizobium sp. L-8-10]
MPTENNAFDVVLDDGSRVVSLGADIGLYFDLPYGDVADEILFAFEIFLDRCPKKLMRWYMTGAMQKHHRVNSRTFGILNAWLKVERRPRETIFFELRDGDEYVDTARWRFTVFANSRESFSFEERSNYIQILMPAEILSDDPEAFAALTHDICDKFPFASGHAGYVLERSPYAPNKAYPLAYPLAMRHPGADMSDMFEASYAVKEGGIKGVNWLTALGPPFVKRLGGVAQLRAQLKPDVNMVETRHGTILRAGERPETGDVNRRRSLPAYRAAFGTIKPVLVDWYPSFNLQRADEDDLTERWLHRFDDNV